MLLAPENQGNRFERADDDVTTTETLLRRLDALETRVTAQRETIARQQTIRTAQRERIRQLRRERADDDLARTSDVGVRAVGFTAALAGLVGLGTRTASADPQGEFGSSSTPLSAVYTATLNGGVTGDTAAGLTGNALTVTSGDELASPWTESDADGLLELDASNTSYTGIDVDTVEADFVDVAHRLPKYSNVGNDAQQTVDALKRLFDAGTWTSGNYRSGASHATTSDAFGGAVMTQTGEVVLVPAHATEVGLYDPSTDTYSTGSFSTSGSTPYFTGGALAATGEVVFAPSNSDVVGVYDPATDTYTQGATHGESGQAFKGATLAATGEVVFAPSDSGNVGIYDPSSDSYTSGPAHGNGAGNGTYFGCALTQYGDVVFAPASSYDVGRYTPSDSGDGTFTTTTSHSQGSGAFNGAAVAPTTGEVVFAPALADSVGVYTPESDSANDTLRTTAHSASGGTAYFIGVAPTPTGDMLFVPNEADAIGIYDPNEDSYTNGPSHGEGADAFAGGALTPSGQVVLAANDSSNVGVFDAFAQTTNPRSTALHPLVNSS